ncbi:unnamed protein product [Paramecium pentaurelia]|uniref:Uncharacterized protein n=1 Tax=Paramecium pentaurelia TaxID=43138 RepID=A0A8S1SQL4_9CILI|nr:unnamed protein product [Paramecium pentaurelia]
MKESVYSMELGELLGTRPRILRKERNIGADKFIYAYLSNDKIHYSLTSNANWQELQFKSTPQLLKSNQANPNKMRYFQHDENRVEDSIDQFKKSSIQQQQHFLNQQIQESEKDVNCKKDLSQQSSKSNSIKSKNNQTHSKIADKNENNKYLKIINIWKYYKFIILINQQLENCQRLKNKVNQNIFRFYVRNSTQQQGILYSSIRYGYYKYEDASYKQVVELKNRYYLSEMMNNEFVTTNKNYRYGLKGYTKFPIYPSSKPQNIDKE